jgi:CheY-like chemotaxis protein
MVGGRCRILVIEDDRETAEQLVEALATNGYEVDLAVDSDDGLSRGRSAEYGVMTIDRMLPGIDGIAIIRRLREEGRAALQRDKPIRTRLPIWYSFEGTPSAEGVRCALMSTNSSMSGRRSFAISSYPNSPMGLLGQS